MPFPVTVIAPLLLQLRSASAAPSNSSVCASSFSSRSKFGEMSFGLLRWVGHHVVDDDWGSDDRHCARGHVIDSGDLNSHIKIKVLEFHTIDYKPLTALGPYYGKSFK